MTFTKQRRQERTKGDTGGRFSCTSGPAAGPRPGDRREHRCVGSARVHSPLQAGAVCSSGGAEEGSEPAAQVTSQPCRKLLGRQRRPYRKHVVDKVDKSPEEQGRAVSGVVLRCFVRQPEKDQLPCPRRPWKATHRTQQHAWGPREDSQESVCHSVAATPLPSRKKSVISQNFQSPHGPVASPHTSSRT